MGFGTGSQMFRPSDRPIRTVSSQTAFSEPLMMMIRALHRIFAEVIEHFASDVLAEPEVERDAVELPRIQQIAGVFVATGGLGGEPDLVGDAGDDGAVDGGVFDNQQVAPLLG